MKKDNLTNDQKVTNIIVTILLSPFLILKYIFMGFKQIFVSNKPKENKYVYSEKTLKKLQVEKEKLLKDLIEAGATRSEKSTIYYYKIKNKEGKIVTGTMNAFSKLDVNSFLVSEGNEVYNIVTSSWINFVYQESTLFGINKLSNKEIILFTSQLSTYLKAGLTIGESIKILSKQVSKNKGKIRKLKSLSYEITLGSSFSASLEKQGNLFPKFLINMLKSSEAAGTVIETLDELSDYYTKLNQSKKEMISALTYPSIVLVFSIGVIIFIMLFIVPQFTSIYQSNSEQMTGITKYVIDFSNFMQTNILTILLILFIIIISFMFLYKNSKEFKKWTHIIILHLPIFKNVIMYNELNIITKTFASLLKNGVFITESLDILKNITNNEIYKEILTNANKKVINGNKVSDAFNTKYVPEVAYFMMVAGEEAGDLEGMMKKVSEYFSDSHKSMVSTMKATIEPILTVFLALIVGLIIIAVIVPMYGIYDDVSLG